MESKQKRNSRLFIPGILCLGPATRSAGEPGEHRPRIRVWQGDWGAAGLAGVAERSGVRWETRSRQGAGKEGDTGLAGHEGDTVQAGCQAGGGHGADRVPSWRVTRGWQGGRVPRRMEARGKHGGDTL